MDQVGSVTFEDLFDFSPEPLNPSSPQIFEFNSGVKLTSNPTPDSYQISSIPPSSNEATFKLSQSVPSSWGSHLQNPFHSNSLSFNSAVDNLIDDLPTEEREEEAATKRGRKPGSKLALKSDMKTKLERSRQSARECRARKKLRYQYLDDLILEREKANNLLREELVKYKEWCVQLDRGVFPEGLRELLKEIESESIMSKTEAN